MLASLPIRVIMLLFLLLPLPSFTTGVIILAEAAVARLCADLIADATHLVEAAFGTVPYYYFPSSKYFLLAQADGWVADAAALFVVFGCV